jgi:ketosteroid isomerase-like protein
MSNTDVVRRAYAAFQLGNIPAVLETFAPDVTWFTPGPPEIPFAGRRQGREQVGEFFVSLDAVLEFQEFTPEQYIEQGETVVVFGKDRARLKSSGQTLDGEWAHVMTVRDGQITDFHEFSDTSALVDLLRQATTRVA